MAWPKESWEILAGGGLLSVAYLTATVLEPLKGYDFVDEPPWSLHQLLCFVEPSSMRFNELIENDAHRGLFEDKDPLGTLDTITLSGPMVGVVLATQAYLFTAGQPATRLATRTLLFANEMSFEGRLVEGGEPEMLIGSTQPAVVDSLAALLRRSDCIVLE